MPQNSALDHEWNRGEGGMAERTVDADKLTAETEALEEQIAVLEEGLSWAPGMQRAALAKEINEYREKLDAARHALGVTGGGVSR